MLCEVQLERKIQQHVTWPCHGLVHPMQYRLSSGISNLEDMARWAGANLRRNLTLHQLVAFETGKQRVEMARAEMHDRAQGGRGREGACQIVAMTRAIEQQTEQHMAGRISRIERSPHQTISPYHWEYTP